MRETRANRAARETFLSELLTEALAGQPTWLTVQEYRWEATGGPHGGATVTATVRVPGGTQGRQIGTSDLSRAFRALTDTPESTGVPEDLRLALLDARRASDLDAIDLLSDTWDVSPADLLLQIALLGEWKHGHDYANH